MPHNMRQVKEAMAEYLSLPNWNWDLYITQTFDDKKCKQYNKICEHSWRYFMNYVGKQSSMAYGWMFAEKGKSGRLHWHALVHIDLNLFQRPSKEEIWAVMYRKYGRNTVDRCELVFKSLEGAEDAQAAGVALYLTKYVAKDSFGGDATWDFEGFMGGSQASAAEICVQIGLNLPPTQR